MTRTQKLEETKEKRERRTGVREFASHQEARELLGLEE